jgi:hypothetical protein
LIVLIAGVAFSTSVFCKLCIEGNVVSVDCGQGRTQCGGRRRLIYGESESRGGRSADVNMYHYPMMVIDLLCLL